MLRGEHDGDRPLGNNLAVGEHSDALTRVEGADREEERPLQAELVAKAVSDCQRISPPLLPTALQQIHLLCLLLK